MNLLGVLALGLFLGVRHATDADHVVAVSTIVSRERTTRSAMLVGALWGLGHTLTILLVGGAIVIFGLVISPRAGLGMELCVACMLIGLGLMNVTGAMRRIDEAVHGGPPGEHAHEHGGPNHAGTSHGGPSSRRAVPSSLALAARLRPLFIGIIHGLAGSAALALLVLTTIDGTASAIVYLAVFGLGTVIGMMLLTALVALPVAAASRRFASFDRTLARLTGVVSIAFGLFLAYEVCFVEGLFLEDTASLSDQ